MEDFVRAQTKDGFRFKIWRGERMALLGFDVDAPEADFVGFAVEYLEPGDTRWKTLHNRIAFSYDAPATVAVTGNRTFPTTKHPLQKFRWVHFPWEPRLGEYRYRATKMHMPSDGVVTRGTSIELAISLDPVTYTGAIDVGFTRNFASSQAFESFKIAHGITTDVIPPDPDDGLGFDKSALAATGVYEWLGFEAHALLFAFLDEAVRDASIEVDAMIYDFNEPDLLARLEALGPRLRVIVDDSSKLAKKTKKEIGHLARSSPESKAATRLRKTAGKSHVKRGHFKSLQHNKVLIAKRNGVPIKVVTGSTNFSFRGLYIQANNLIVFDVRGVAKLFADMFEVAFDDMAGFTGHELARKWHVVPSEGGAPAVHVCFAPHSKSALSLSPAGAAIDQATSAVFYSFAFMNQTKSGEVRKALDRLMSRPLFSYGVVDEKTGMEIRKPDGARGLVDFAYLADHAPEPFRSEWSGGQGINIHHKFVVTDFDKPTAKVFTGSSNFSPSGEAGNGDHMLMIEDQKIALAYTIEALRVFDHLRFRNVMQEADETKRPTKLILQKPIAISGRKEPWFADSYVAGSQAARDRKLFAS